MGAATLAEARRLAVEALKQLDAGLNPRHEERRKARDRVTFGEVARGLHRAANASPTAPVAQHHLLPAPGVPPGREDARRVSVRQARAQGRGGSMPPTPVGANREVSHLDRAAVRERLNAIARRNLWAGRHAHASLRRLFSWAVEQERLIQHLAHRGRSHPVNGHRQTAAASPPRVRRGAARRAPRRRDADVGRARRALQEPRTTTKFQITPKVHELLDQLPRFEGCEWLFSTTGKRPVCDFTRRKHRSTS